MQATNRTIKEYLNSLDETVRDDVVQLHELITKHMPNITPKMWEGTFWGGSEQSIIGYGDLIFTRSDKTTVEWFMVGLSLQKNYISVYNCATIDGKYAVKVYGNKLGKAKIGSSSISFKKLDDIKIDELVKLVDLAYEQLSK